MPDTTWEIVPVIWVGNKTCGQTLAEQSGSGTMQDGQAWSQTGTEGSSSTQLTTWAAAQRSGNLNQVLQNKQALDLERQGFPYEEKSRGGMWKDMACLEHAGAEGDGIGELTCSCHLDRGTFSNQE